MNNSFLDKIQYKRFQGKNEWVYSKSVQRIKYALSLKKTNSKKSREIWHDFIL